LQAVGFDGDVRKQEDAARVIAATVEHFGKLDILVNGAAGNFLASPEDLKPKGFRTGTPSWHALVLIQCYSSFQFCVHCCHYYTVSVCVVVLGCYLKN
jgi:peroxisomal 2,4-dienoyl-CoA reductase